MNCLSSVLNGKKEFPKAWEAKVEKFILENTVPPIPEPMATLLVKADEWQLLKFKEQQFGKIEKYELRIAQLEDEIKKLVNKPNTQKPEKAITVENTHQYPLEEKDMLLPPIETMFKAPVNKYDEHKDKISNSGSRQVLISCVNIMKKEMFLNNKQKMELEAYAKQVLEEKGFVYND